MFTGIIRDKGRIIAIAEGDNSRRMTIATKLDLSQLISAHRSLALTFMTSS